MPRIPPNYECFYCGLHFSESESIAHNTSELYSRMFCSRECEDKDTEMNEREIELAKQYNEFQEHALSDIPAVSGTQIIDVGGFKMRVPIKKEN